MSKVGTLDLTEEQRKRTFHLPIRQSVLVPSTSGIKEQKRISNDKLKKRVNNVRKFLSKRFGGFTDVKATGGFVLRNGKLVKERVVKVTSFATKKDFKKHKSSVLKKVSTWGKKWKQEAVSYTNEGDLFIIEPKKKKRTITPTTRRKLLANLVKARKAIKR
jgi:hypothetical protein|tara:strand:- start:291 stop:773 length:483 start_codon:yes stop_codon:yes gene_type:complete